MIKKLYNNISIKHKMILGFISVSLVSVMVMVVFSRYYFGQAIKEDFLMLSGEATKRISHHMEFYFKQLSQSSANLVKDSLIQDFLAGRKKLDSFEIQNVEKELKKHILFNYPETVDVFLLAKDKRIISMSGSFNSENWDYGSEPWYNADLPKRITVFPTHWVEYPQQNRNVVMSMVIPIYDVNNIESIGALIIDFVPKEISKTLEKSNLGETGVFFIVSDDDTIVYHPVKDWMGLNRSQTPLRDINLELNGNTSIQNYMHKKNLIAVSKLDDSDWSIVSAVAYDEMDNGLEAAERATFLAFIVIALAIIILVPLFSNIFVKPLLRLKRMMEYVTKGDLSVRVKNTDGTDEFQQLNKSFNSMVEQLDELMNTVSDLKLKEMHLLLRQKEALIGALQNQINPHLLYNTLDIIKSIAYLENVPRIVTMSSNLASFYRYNAKFSDAEVLLEDELKHLEKYLEIIHVRFPKNFESRIIVNEKFYNCLCQKLILQPIAENAVKYSIEPRSGKGTVFVSAYEENGDLLIEIADDGPGIERETLGKLKDQMATISEKIEAEYIQNDSLGLSNVHARLVLKYGKGYGVRIESFPGVSTVVSIRIPFKFPG